MRMASGRARLHDLEAVEQFWDHALRRLESYIAATAPVLSSFSSPQQRSASTMQKIVSREEWLAARKEFLAKEKTFTRLRDRLSAERRDLPWVKLDKPYHFVAADGERTLGDLFEGKSQLIIYHFMFGPTWEQGCPSCSFWADGFDGIIVHLNNRDVAMAAVSCAPIERLQSFRKRMGWTFTWVSSLDGDFNQDFRVSFTAQQLAEGTFDYNYGLNNYGEEAPGISVFRRDVEDHIYHTYSCYGRGLDMLNPAYHYLDLVPKGRDEGEFDYTMAWVRHHDRYGMQGHDPRRNSGTL
jgi:predicted dithiol-disulfide oxidoreductase (DUF899 family)